MIALRPPKHDPLSSRRKASSFIGSHTSAPSPSRKLHLLAQATAPFVKASSASCAQSFISSWELQGFSDLCSPPLSPASSPQQSFSCSSFAQALSPSYKPRLCGISSISIAQRHLMHHLLLRFTQSSFPSPSFAKSSPPSALCLGRYQPVVGCALPIKLLTNRRRQDLILND